MWSYIIGIGVVALLGSAYIFLFRTNNKNKKSSGCGGHCDGCAGCPGSDKEK